MLEVWNTNRWRWIQRMRNVEQKTMEDFNELSDYNQSREKLKMERRGSEKLV